MYLVACVGLTKVELEVSNVQRTAAAVLSQSSSKLR